MSRPKPPRPSKLICGLLFRDPEVHQQLLVLRFPKNCLGLEDQTRKHIAQRFQRGRIEVFLQVEPVAVELKGSRINVMLARHYWDQLQQLATELPGGNPPTLADLLRFSDIFESANNTVDQASPEPLLTSAVTAALEDLDQMRSREGQTLVRDLLPRVSWMNDAIARVEDRRVDAVADTHRRLRERLQELLGEAQVDEDRLMQELAILADRSDVTEEIVRARSHLEQLRQLLLGSESAPGRKLDFLTQELHREVNTIGSKANDLDIAQTVVQMKSEVAKLREQVQNIE
jgi:uncharacterized protein (TIGR00255 family)